MEIGQRFDIPEKVEVAAYRFAAACSASGFRGPCSVHVGGADVHSIWLSHDGEPSRMYALIRDEWCLAADPEGKEAQHG